MKQIKDKKEIIIKLSENPVKARDIGIFDRRVFYPMYYSNEYNIKFNKEKREFYIAK